MANKRHPAFEKNRFARIIIAISIAIAIIYLIFTGIFLPVILREVSPHSEPHQLFNGGMCFLLALDFGFRLLFQEIPAQEVKPYILLPVPKKALIQCFLIRSALGTQNLYWMAMLLPFAGIAIFPAHGISGVAGFLIGYWLLFLINNYWYLLCRTLMNQHIGFALLPVLLYGGSLVLTGLLPENALPAFCMQLGGSFITWNLLYWLIPLAVLAILYRINLALQQHYIYLELSKTEKAQKLLLDYSFLERWGETGEYMRLEIKLQSRNRNIRKIFVINFILMIFYAWLLCIYSTGENDFLIRFFCIFNFAILGVTTLVKIMNAEGNYLDGLLCRKESILSLLKAKYYLYTILLIVPLLLTIPSILLGNVTWLMALACLFMTSGPIYALLFQMAVYNNQTASLNNIVIGKDINNRYQALVAAIATLSPILLYYLFTWIFGETTGLIILLLAGIVITCLHPLWLRNIYQRFMKRRYINIEGFRNTR